MTYDQSAVQAILDQVLAEGRSSLSALQGAKVCEAYGIPVPHEGLARSSDAAVDLAQNMGFPVVLKIVSPDILHKTEAGGVLVGLASAEAVASASVCSAAPGVHGPLETATSSGAQGRGAASVPHLAHRAGSIRYMGNAEQFRPR